ncbi:hypothetical protein LINGRAHAP2_LOCUS35429, partial [Linum grandiflorum]
WTIRLIHSYCEVNCVADYLANIDHSYSFGLHLFDLPDQSLSHMMYYDFVGVSLPGNM